MPILVVRYQRSQVHREARFPQWHTHTDRHTTHGHRNLQTELAQRANSVKM